jgi:hypothetical protein
MGETVNSNTVRSPQGKPVQMLTMQCQNLHCRWYMTNWIVQVDEDGKVPVRDSGHEPKTFPRLNKIMTQEEVKAYFEAVAREVPDDEIR